MPWRPRTDPPLIRMTELNPEASPTAPSAADPQADSLWRQGQQRGAIERLLERINREAGASQRQLVLQLVEYVRQLGDGKGAERLLQQLLQQQPFDREVEAVLAALMGAQGSLSAVPHPDAAVLGAWVGSPLTFAAAPGMPAQVTGLVINLDAAVERWQSMARQIASLGWSATHGRFPALRATQEEAQGLGLRSAGELGLWRSTKALLAEWLAGDPGPEAVLHVMEDDAVLHPALPKLVQVLQTGEPRVHLLFSEAFLTRELYERFRALEQRRQAEGHSLLLLRGGCYLACASSYLLTRSGAERCYAVMQQLEAQGRLLPIDLCYRALIRRNGITAAVSLPFLSTIAPVQDSAIQTGLKASVSLAKTADLALRRLLYLQSWDADAGVKVWRELAALMEQGLGPDQHQQLILMLLSYGRDQGWLANY